MKKASKTFLSALLSISYICCGNLADGAASRDEESYDEKMPSDLRTVIRISYPHQNSQITDVLDPEDPETAVGMSEVLRDLVVMGGSYVTTILSLEALFKDNIKHLSPHQRFHYLSNVCYAGITITRNFSDQSLDKPSLAMEHLTACLKYINRFMSDYSALEKSGFQLSRPEDYAALWIMHDSSARAYNKIASLMVSTEQAKTACDYTKKAVYHAQKAIDFLLETAKRAPAGFISP